MEITSKGEVKHYNVRCDECNTNFRFKKSETTPLTECDMVPLEDRIGIDFQYLSMVTCPLCSCFIKVNIKYLDEIGEWDIMGEVSKYGS